MADELALTREGALFSNPTLIPGHPATGTVVLTNHGPAEGQWTIATTNIAGSCASDISISGSALEEGAVVASGSLGRGQSAQVPLDAVLSGACQEGGASFDLRVVLAGEAPAPAPDDDPVEEPTPEPTPTVEPTIEPTPDVVEEPPTSPAPVDPGPAVVGGGWTDSAVVVPDGHGVDLDGDGVLTGYEDWLWSKHVRGEAQIAAVDTDGDGVISRAEMDAQLTATGRTDARLAFTAQGDRHGSETTSGTQDAGGVAGSLADTGGDLAGPLTLALALITAGLLMMHKKHHTRRAGGEE